MPCSSAVQQDVALVGLTAGVATTLILDSAERLSHDLLGDFDDRWKHTLGVARRAQRLADLLLPDQESRHRLVSAAWLHDIGHSPGLHRSGFSPLDGALHLERLAWPTDVTALVAHHSGARFVAQVLGLADPLTGKAARYPSLDDLTTDLLTYADQTVGPRGTRLKVEDRIHDSLLRHGPGSPVARAHRRRGPYLLQVAERTRALLVHWS